MLARILPELVLERHLSVGLRPCLRKFNEFRAITADSGLLNSVGTNSLVGLAVARNGTDHAFCGITIGVAEVKTNDELLGTQDSRKEYATVHPVVEIARGRTGAPTDEEMILSQNLYNAVLHLHVLPLELLEVEPGYQLTNEETHELFVVYPHQDALLDEDLNNLSSTINVSKRKYKYVLYAHVKIFSRSGPLFDLAHYVLLAALQNVQLPRIYIADSGIDPNVRVPVRSRGNFGHLSLSANRFCVDDGAAAAQLVLESDSVGTASSFGLVDHDGATVLLADLEGEAEEACAQSRVTAVTNGSDKLTHLHIAGGGANMTISTIREAIAMAKVRARAA